MAYRDVVLADNPVTYWSCDDTMAGEGSYVPMPAGSADLTFAAGAPAGLGGKSREAGSFSDSQFPTPASTSDVTLEAWIRWGGPASAARGILSQRLDGTANTAVGAYVAASNLSSRITFDLGVGSSARQEFAWTPTQGVWQHVVLRYVHADGSRRLWVDGSQVASVTQARGANGYSQGRPMTVGRLGGVSGSAFLGALAGVAVYHSALTAERILAHHQAGSTAQAATLALVAAGASSASAAAVLRASARLAAPGSSASAATAGLAVRARLIAAGASALDAQAHTSARTALAGLGASALHGAAHARATAGLAAAGSSSADAAAALAAVARLAADGHGHTLATGTLALTCALHASGTGRLDAAGVLRLLIALRATGAASTDATAHLAAIALLQAAGATIATGDATLLLENVRRLYGRATIAARTPSARITVRTPSATITARAPTVRVGVRP